MAVEAKPRSIKVSDEMWAAWQAQAKARGISTTALIVERMTGGLPASVPPAKAGPTRKEAALARRFDPKAKAQPVRATREDYAPGDVGTVVGDAKVVASVLPVTGDRFPKRPVYLRGQSPGKGKR